MYNVIALALIFTSLFSCTITENGLVFGVPEYEKRDIDVTQNDLEILLKTRELLVSKNSWVKNSIRECSGSSPYSLYCALEFASKIVDGKYIHRRPALQEVRFAIDDRFNERWKVHRLADFNAHQDTSHADVIKVIEIALERVKDKLSGKNLR